MDLQQVLAVWRDWGVFAGFLVSLLAAFAVFYDSSNRGLDATLWKVIVVVTTILVIPSLLFKVTPDMMAGLKNAYEPLSYLGILASVVALIGLIAYLFYARQQSPMDSTAWASRATQQGGYSQQAYNYPTTPAGATPQSGLGATAQPAAEPTTQQTRQSSEPPTDEIRAVNRSGDSSHTVILETNKPPRPLAYLVMRGGPRHGKTYDLRDVTAIGREAKDNEVILEDSHVSGRHAKIRLENGEFYLWDLASANGTFVKDRASGEWKKVEGKWPAPLTDGDNIKFAEQTMSFMHIRDAA
ncbi:MAG: FHA domain-containing protein [Chloroflexi bacterium]|nr:FHA domain-containing protein [Chloroflexota bacterium]